MKVINVNKMIIFFVFLFLAALPLPARAIGPGTVAGVVIGAIVVKKAAGFLTGEFLDDLFNRDCISFPDAYIRALARAAGATKEQVGERKPVCLYFSGGASGGDNRKTSLKPQKPITFEEHVKTTIEKLIMNHIDATRTATAQRCEDRFGIADLPNECLRTIYDKTGANRNIRRLLAGNNDSYVFARMEFNPPQAYEDAEKDCTGSGMIIISGEKFIAVKWADDGAGWCGPFMVSGHFMKTVGGSLLIYYSEITQELNHEGIFVDGGNIIVAIEKQPDSYIGKNRVLIAGFETGTGESKAARDPTAGFFIHPYIIVIPSEDSSGDMEDDKGLIRK